MYTRHRRECCVSEFSFFNQVMNDIGMTIYLGSGSREQMGKAFLAAGLLPPSEQVQSTRGMGSDNAARIASDGGTKRVVRINID